MLALLRLRVGRPPIAARLATETRV